MTLGADVISLIGSPGKERHYGSLLAKCDAKMYSSQHQQWLRGCIGEEREVSHELATQYEVINWMDSSCERLLVMTGQEMSLAASGLEQPLAAARVESAKRTPPLRQCCWQGELQTHVDALFYCFKVFLSCGYEESPRNLAWG